MGDLLRRLSSLRSFSASTTASPTPNTASASYEPVISGPISLRQIRTAPLHPIASPAETAADPSNPSIPALQSQSQSQSESQTQTQTQPQPQTQTPPQTPIHSAETEEAFIREVSSPVDPQTEPDEASSSGIHNTIGAASNQSETPPQMQLQSPIQNTAQSQTQTQSQSPTQGSVTENSQQAMMLYIEGIRRMAMEAVISNRHQNLQDFFNAGVFDIDELFGGRVKRTLLHCAASFGSKECVEIILKNGANINLQDSAGNTALHLSAQNGYKECLKILLDRGADTQICNKDGFTALHWLATNGHTDLLKILVERTNCVTDILDLQYRTPLHMACQNGHKESVLYLIKHGADVMKKDKQNRSTLMYASKHGQYDCIKLLLDQNVPLDQTGDADGPLELCIKAGSNKSCYLLISRFPSLVSRLVQLTARLEFEEQKIVSVFEYLCSDQWKADIQVSALQRFPFQTLSALGSFSGADYKSFKIPIVHTLEEVTAITGHQLLSLSSDPQTVADVFIRQMVLLSKLIPRDWQSRFVKETPRRTSFRNASSILSIGSSHASASSDDTSPYSRSPGASSSLSGPETPEKPRKLASAESSSDQMYRSPLEDLWLTMEEWLLLLSSMSSSLVDKPLPPPKPSFFQRKSLNMADRKIQQALAKMSLTEKFDEVGEPSQGEPSSFPNTLEEPDSENGHGHSLDIKKEPEEEQSDAKEKLPHDDNEATAQSSPKGTPELSGSGSFDELLPRYFNRIAAIVHGFYLYCCTLEIGRRGETNDSPGSSRAAKNYQNQRILSPRFRRFIDDHLSILRLLVRHDPKVLFEHFHFLLDHHSIMSLFMDLVRAHPFDLRKEWFYGNLDLLIREKTGYVQSDGFNEQDPLVIDRHNPFEASCDLLAKALSGEREIAVLSNLAIRFDGEAGIGAGVRREWFNVMSKEIVNPDYGLFVPSSDGVTVQPNTHSHINPDHLSYFRFAGWVVGLAILHRELLDVYFTRSFYKHILGAPISMNDLVSIDPEYHKSLKWLLENNIDECGLELVFSVELDSFGETQQVELKPNGNNIPVTEENKHEYVQLAAEFKMTSAIGLQICSFLEGFERFIPHSLVCMFDEYELELMISGTPSIDLEDWRAHTDYSGMEPTDEMVDWFWNIVSEMTNQERVLLLQFVTGSSRVPLGGFRALMGSAGPTRFTLSLMNEDESRLPTSSTCFNLMKVPRYHSRDEFKDRISIALRCGSKGFEFA